MVDKIKTINNYKLLARLHALTVKKESVNNGVNPDDIDKIITNFKISYPNIDTSDLKEVYEIPNGDCTYQQIREYNYTEYETKYHDGYEELLELSKLCSKYLGYSPFRTMVGEIYYSAEDFKAYEVIYIQEEFKSEQIFVLLNQEHNLVKTVKVDEWSCGRLNSHNELYSSKENMIKAYEKISYSRFQDTLKRVERLKKEL